MNITADNYYIMLAMVIAAIIIVQRLKYYRDKRRVIEELKRVGFTNELALMRMYCLSHLQIYRILNSLRKQGLVERLEDQPTWLYRWRWVWNKRDERERKDTRKKDDE